jgi:PPOX class probable F420-dependent enzyme
MGKPRASRPHMPGYGVVGPDQGSGLLPWSWAREQLTTSPNYWVVTLWPDGRPHAMPVWGVWDDDPAAFWFSSSLRSRKARNVAADPRCVVTIENARDPVVVEGTAEVITDRNAIARYLELSNAKYETDYPLDFLDPGVNATMRVWPRWAFGLVERDFTGSPTRWVFEDPASTGLS